MSRNMKRTAFAVVMIVILLTALSQVLPNYTYVSITGPDGSVQVERAGFGPQSTKVETPNGYVESSAR